MSEQELKEKNGFQRQRSHDFDMEGEELNIGELIGVVKAQKLFIGIVMAVAFLLACVYIINLPPKFQTTALIQIDGNNSNMDGLLKNLDSSGGGASQIIFGGGSASPAQIESVLMTSRFILQPTIESLGLNINVEQHYFPFFGSYKARHHVGEGLAKPFMGFNSYSWGGEKITVKQFSLPNDYYDKQFKIKAGENGSYKLYSPDDKFILNGTVGKLATTSEFDATPGWNDIFYQCQPFR